MKSFILFFIFLAFVYFAKGSENQLNFINNENEISNSKIQNDNLEKRFHTELDGIKMENIVNNFHSRKLLGEEYIDPVKMNEDLKKCLKEKCEFPMIDGKIPKIVHFVWFQSPEIPASYQETLRTWKNSHPDWIFFLWTHVECEEIIKRHFSWFLDFYNNFEYMIQKIDAARYFIIYLFGGLVTDIDLAAQKNLTPLISKYITSGNDVILLPSVNMGGLSNGFAVSVPKSNFHSRVIQNLKNPHVPAIIKYTWYLNPAKRHTWIMLSAGPRFITNERIRYLNLPVYEQVSSIGLFEPKKFLPCTACTPKPCTCPDCYIIMLEGGLWHEKDSKMLDGLRCFFEPLVTTRIHIVLILYLALFGTLVFLFHHYRDTVLPCISKLYRKNKGDKFLAFSSKPQDLKV